MIGLIFDLDGTLIDSAPDIQFAVNQMLASEGQYPLDLPTVTSFVGQGLPKLVERVIRHVGLNPDHHTRLVDSTLSHYHTGHSQTRLYPDVLEALQGFQSAGHPMGLCTNKPIVPTEEVLKSVGLEHFFKSVICGDSLPTRKPDPAPLMKVAADIRSATFLYIGDSETDAETAERAKVPFLLYTEGYRKTPLDQMRFTSSFSDFRELPALVEQLS